MIGAGVFLLGLPFLAGVLGLAAAFLVGGRRARRLSFDEAAYPGLQALRRNTVAFRWAGIVLGLGAGVVVLPLGPHAPFAFAAPLVTAIVAVAAILVGQQLSYGRARSAGSAGLETRRVGDYLPVGLTLRAVGATATLLVVALFTTLAASPDDAGRPGRSLSAWWQETLWEADAAGVLQPTVVPYAGTTSPFPGSFHTVWVVVALVVLFAVAAVGLVLTARRPRNGADPELVRVDDALRRITAEGIVAATGAGVAGAVLGLAALAYPRLGSFAQVPVYLAASYLMAVVALGALVLTLAFAVVLLVPGNGDRR